MGKEPQPLNGDGGEWEFPSAKELGALLRAKREEMGLTYAQISDQIKVKAGYLEALENEEWDHLPSPAFIKGFIRSYARELGLSEEGLIALYQETAPPPQPMPRPLQAAPKKNRVPLYLILVFAVLAGGVAVYHWIEHPSFKGKPAEEGTALSADERSDDTPAGQDDRLKKEEAPHSEAQQMSGPIDIDRELPRENPAPVPGPEEPGSVDQPAEASPNAEAQVSPSEAGKRREAETPVPDTAQASESESPPLVLKAAVRERTWVRVTIDDQKPKEYIFDPKSSPEWRAHKGFELLIGNAGGIDLEFNGQKMEDLGKQGQVIKLRLPAGDGRSVSAD
jgi:cytoskeleton protein RodZ